MARFKNKDLRLGTNEEILFGDSQEASIKYDGSDLVTDYILRHSTQGYFATQEFVNDALMGLEWQDSVLSITTDIPAGVYGDRYIIPAGATGAWSGRDDDIAEYTTTWVYTTPSAGFAAWVEDAGAYYVYSSGSWVKLGTVVDHSLLDNLDVDDHTQYVLADGTREVSGTLQAVSVSAGTFEGPGYTHAGLVDEHNLTTDINHNTILNNHNLTTSINHDTITNNHNLTTDINHNALTNYDANRHIDWTNASDNLLTSGNVSAADFYGDGSNLSGIETPTVSGSDVDLFLGDTNKLYLGSDNDSEIYHSGSHAYWDNATGDTFIRFPGSEIAIKCTQNGSVTLYHNGISRLVTGAAGITVTGDVAPTDDFYASGTGTYYMGDTPDAQIYHNNTNSYWDTVTGSVYIRTNSASENLFVGVPNAGVTLYWDGNAKFETTTAGIEVTGDVQGDTFTAGTSAGVTGFFDDGANFRITVTEGLVTTIGASVSGGYQIG
jgi:hypothetical protein